jgi:hypothetical protein
MNGYGRVVTMLLLLGAAMSGIALARGQVDGALTLAVASLAMASAITFWTFTNRKRTDR